jgi:hypothetical protein
MSASGKIFHLVISLWLLIAGSAWGGELLYIQVAETRLRERPAFLSPSLQVVRYGDELLSVTEKSEAGWIEVLHSSGMRGWVHRSALTAARLVLKAGERSTSVGAERAETTLAGKGFSAETEEDYRQQNAELPFEVLDRLPQLSPADDEVLVFLQQGGLAQ